MISKKLVLILAAFLSVAGGVMLHAQTTAFSYQGRLFDGDAPASGTYDLMFTLYDSSNSPGTVVAGPITNSAVTVTNGLFTTTLDFGSTVFNGSDRWLAIGVATNGSGVFTDLSPRQPLTSTPYAIQSLNAATAASADSVLAGNISGTVSLAQLPTTVLVTNGASGVNISGTFSGDGGGVTNVNLLYANTQGAITFSTNGGFVLASSPTVGNSSYSDPHSVTAADVNGDGHPDLISADYGDNTLTVLTNDGSGNFVKASSLGVGGYPSSVVAADVNGDGHPDLISANLFDGTLSVLTNDDSGGFVTSSTLSVGSMPNSVVAADVNRDGHPDLICANEGDNTLTVLTNNGSGGFATASTVSVNPGPAMVIAVDINGDGYPDLITPSSLNSLTVLTNDGSGGFVLASSPGVGEGPDSVAAADVNGDGYPDLISANNYDNTLTVLTNDGSGGFVLASSPSVGKGPYSVTAADVNGDGHPDLISADSSAKTLTVLTNDGSGGFVLASSPGVGKFPTSVVAVDVNNDGYLDLISANYYTNTLSVLLNVPFVSFVGDGSGLTGLNAANLTGSVPAASLTSVPATNLTGTISSAQLPATVVKNQETGVTLGGTFAGNGGGLTNLNANNISSGTVPLAQLPTTLVTNGASGVNISGTFSGDGSALTNVPGDNLGNHTATQNLNLNGHWLSGNGNSEGLFVDANGNVGIGTNSPGETLEVVGNALLTTASDPKLLFQRNDFYGTRESAIQTTFATGVRVPPFGPADQHLSFCVSDATNTDMTRVMDLLGNGYVGIGTTAPSNTLSVAGNANITGNVGIGTATPQTALDVKGNIRFTSGQNRYPVASDLQTVMVAGIVTSTGNPSGASSSALFTSTNSSTGTYVLTFNAGFTADPIVTVTARGASYNASLVTASTTGAVINLHDNTGALVNAPFNFIAIGQR